MKFTCSVEIALPRSRVIELFNDPNNLKEWQDGFMSLEHLSGTAGQPGAKSRLLYQVGGKEMELIETIQSNNLPDEFSGIYEAKPMVNTMSSRFIKVSEDQTRYQAEVEYLSFHGFMPKLLAFLMPGMFKRQVQKWLNQFKEFAERKG